MKNYTAADANRVIKGHPPLPRLSQKGGDSLEHLEKFYANMGIYPQDVIADAGYGSEENYAWMEKKGIDAYVKYNSFHYERKRDYKKKRPYGAEAFVYQQGEDEYECPQGKKLRFEKEAIRRTESGYESKRRIYRCVDCSGCPVKGECTRGRGDRQISVGAELERYRRTASERLESEQGRRYRSKRPVDVEVVFGRLKQNWGFRRFTLRGLEKVSTEWGILSIAHNIAKVASA